MKFDLVESQNEKRNRLSESVDCHPWVRANELQIPGTYLYWLPVSTFPMRLQQREWLKEFLLRISLQMKQKYKLRSEYFISYKMLSGELIDSYKRYAFKCTKMIGLGRTPNTDLPSFPTEEQMKEYVRTGKEFDYRDWVGDYLLWLIHPEKREQLELFLGTGETTFLVLPPDPKIKVPHLPFTPALREAMPVFQKMDVDGRIAAAFSMQDAFLEKSKLMFGPGLEETVEYMALSFILPLLQSQHFFAATPEAREEWFGLFDLYVTESRNDKGILLAFQKESYEQDVLAVLDQMATEGYYYGDKLESKR